MKAAREAEFNDQAVPAATGRTSRGEAIELIRCMRGICMVVNSYFYQAVFLQAFVNYTICFVFQMLPREKECFSLSTVGRLAPVTKECWTTLLVSTTTKHSKYRESL